MDHLRAMRLFTKAVDEGSFAGAARAYDLSPAVVTREIGDLESHLGARLFQRTTRHLHLTQAGSDYLAVVRPLLAQLDEAEAAVASGAVEVRGVLRIAAPPELSRHQLVRVLPEFLQAHPQLRVEVFTPVTPGAIDSRADVSMLVAGGAPLDGEFIARRVARATAVLCASPEYLRRHGRPQHPKDLAQHHVMVASLPGLPNRFVLTRADGGESHAHELPEGRFASPHPDVMVAAARAGMGIGAALSITLANALRRGDVERVLPDWRLQDWSVYACYASRQHLPKSVRAFLEHLSARYPDPDVDPWLPAAASRRSASLAQSMTL